MATAAVAEVLLEQGQLVAIAMRYGVVGVEVLNPSLLGGRRCFSIAAKGFNIPSFWDYEDEGVMWSRDTCQEARDALFAASLLARSAA